MNNEQEIVSQQDMDVLNTVYSNLFAESIDPVWFESFFNPENMEIRE